MLMPGAHSSMRVALVAPMGRHSGKYHEDVESELHRICQIAYRDSIVLVSASSICWKASNHGRHDSVAVAHVLQGPTAAKAITPAGVYIEEGVGYSHAPLFLVRVRPHLKFPYGAAELCQRSGVYSNVTTVECSGGMVAQFWHP